MKRKVVVLGCGLVGATMARDMAAEPDFAVTVVDLSESSLAAVSAGCRVTTYRADLSDQRAIAQAIRDADVVLGALPSALGFAALRTVIESGKGYSDISFMPEDALSLDELARARGVSAVVDCGVSPGLSNLLIGQAFVELERTERASILVGGLPVARHWPYQYKAPFAPSDVLEEYTRPARLIENGRVVTRDALSEPELVDFGGIGTLEAFNTDGLRSLLHTLSIPEMKEKTLRYPGHAEIMRVFRDLGLFGKTPIDVRGTSVRPLDVTSALLFPRWKHAPNEDEFTVLRVVVEGTREKRAYRYTYDLLDRYCSTTGTSSMARTTAFPATIVARLLLAGRIRQAGVIPPELLPRHADVFSEIGRGLERRGVALRSRVDELATS